MSDWDQTDANVASPRTPGWDTGTPGDPSAMERTQRGLVAGMRVFGRYVLERQLGRGGMGVVWMAVDEELGEPVALKFLPWALVDDEAALDELREETRKSRRLTHPNIVRVHDFHHYSATGLAAISMEYVDGPTLAALRLAQPNRVFEVEGIVGHLRQLCAALDYAHGRGIIHRDLKPANLMINSAGELKVCDFGIACSIRDSVTRVTGQRGVSGTLVYMSPQQMDGGIPSLSDDIYSLGATLYDLLTGTPPFFSGDIVGQIREKVPPGIAQRRAELEVSGEAILAHWELPVGACLAKDPALRPRSAGEVSAMLGGRGARLDAGTSNNQHPTTNVEGNGSGSGALGAGGERRAASREQRATRAEYGKRKRGKRRAVVMAISVALAMAGGTGWWFAIEVPRRERTEIKRERDLEALRLATARGSLSVTAEPAGALVCVDGGEVRPSPATFAGLKLGKHTISVSAVGYASKEFEAEVTQGRVTEVGPLVLDELMGTVEVRSQPSGAAVIWADGRRVGVTPLRLEKVPAGAVSVRLELEGYGPAEARGIVAGGRETALYAVMRSIAPQGLTRTPSTVAPPFAGSLAGQEMSNSIGMRLCWCPAGQFVMGSPEIELGRHDDEQQHEVCLTKGFWIGKHEVTQDDYGRVVGKNPSKFSNMAPNLPVEGVSWSDAEGFCRNLTERERAAGTLPLDWEYRLPTEAQWEYACRAGTTSNLNNGTDLTSAKGDCRNLDVVGWYDGNSLGSPHRVGEKAANAWGIHDMLGNVFEWCADLYEDYPPGIVSDPIGAASGASRVYRGGSWVFGAHSCRSADRSRFGPSFRDMDLGFRVVAVPCL